MKKPKLKLEQLKLDSFITSIDKISGGAAADSIITLTSSSAPDTKTASATHCLSTQTTPNTRTQTRGSIGFITQAGAEIYTDLC